MARQAWFTSGGGDIPLWKVEAARSAGRWISHMDTTLYPEDLEKAAKKPKPVYTDAGPNTSNGHWVTVNGVHHWFPGPPLTDEQKRLRAYFKNLRDKVPDTFAERIAYHENADSAPTDDSDRVRNPQSGTLGRYQFLDSTLVHYGMKSRLGAAGWGNTPLARAYNIHTDQNFQDSLPAQEGAFGQFMENNQKEANGIYRKYGYHTFEGRGENHDRITLRRGNILSAMQRDSGPELKAYLHKYDAEIRSYATCGIIGRIPPVRDSKNQARELAIETRLRQDQDLDYESDYDQD